MLARLSVWSEVQTCIWPSWCHCHSLSHASVKSKIGFTFLVPAHPGVLDKGPLNECSVNECNHSHYSLYYCILAFTHSCHKLRMSTCNKDQWCYWWWRWLFKVNPSTVTYLIWKTVNNFDGNDDVVSLDCFSGTPYNEKSPRPSISSPLVKPSHTVIISWRRMQSSRVRCAYRGWGTTSATRNR